MERHSSRRLIVWSINGGEELPWLRWTTLVFVAVAGSLIYGASLGLVLTDWGILGAALWLAISAGLAWGILIPTLWRAGNAPLAACIDACLVTMAWGEVVLTAGALLNAGLWWRGAMIRADVLNFGIVAVSNVVMALVLCGRMQPHGMSPGRVWTIWMIALNGSGAVFFFLFYHLLRLP